MNILIFAANWNNRGDESAIRAMIDELRNEYPKAHFKINFSGADVEEIPYDDIEILPRYFRIPRRRIISRILYNVSIKSGGVINLLSSTPRLTRKVHRESFKRFVEGVKWCDLAIFAPGGPTIGDIYKNYKLLDDIDIIRHYKKPYVFFAPSMGPFKQYKRKIKKTLKNAEAICLRESISEGYIKELSNDLDTQVTLDSAFQHDVDEQKYKKQLDEYKELCAYLSDNKKTVGITITDLQWHRLYSTNDFKNRIKESFESFIKYLLQNGYGVVFVPQLFGGSSDKEYMSEYANNNCFVVDDKHDCYFQQYLISQLYAVVGMRYHSNIFSAKMGTPFVSIAYEQKMKGFAEKVGLSEYCFDINELNENCLINHFEKVVCNYNKYSSKLLKIKKRCKEESFNTTKRVMKVIEEKGIDI